MHLQTVVVKQNGRLTTVSHPYTALWITSIITMMVTSRHILPVKSLIFQHQYPKLSVRSNLTFAKFKPLGHLFSTSNTRLNDSSSPSEIETMTKNQQVIPRAAVSVVVRYSQNSGNKYVLVQRGKEPNKGMWSLPGGKIEAGELSLVAAKRELWEETGLCNLNEEENVSHNFYLSWCEDGPICTTDSIHYEKKEALQIQDEIRDGTIHKSEEQIELDVKFHYVISQWFVEAKPKGELIDPPTLVADDDAADAKWWSLDEIQSGVEKGEVTKGVEKVLSRAEIMYNIGFLS